jgi:hypothetical protein
MLCFPLLSSGLLSSLQVESWKICRRFDASGYFVAVTIFLCDENKQMRSDITAFVAATFFLQQ